MNPLHDIADDRIQPDKFVAVIEIPKGSRSKFEIDKDSGMIMLDRVLQTSCRYPINYGFIPRTLCEDGDALDVCVLGGETVYPLTLVNCRPVGVIEMVDNGERDEKIIAIPLYKGNIFSEYNKITDINEVPKYIINEITHFMRVYKDLSKDNNVVVGEIKGRAASEKYIKEAKELYKKSTKK